MSRKRRCYTVTLSGNCVWWKCVERKHLFRREYKGRKLASFVLNTFRKSKGGSWMTCPMCLAMSERRLQELGRELDEEVRYEDTMGSQA